jgi:predicted RNA-binding Zn ribbon-like protein
MLVGDEQLRAPAPLETVRAFVNTRDLELSLEALVTPRDLQRWLSDHGLLDDETAVADADLRCALGLREALRALLLANATRAAPPPEALDAIATAGRRAGLLVRPGPGGLGLGPAVGGVDAAFARLLAIVVIAQADGTWARLKACPGRDCQWALYDRTRSRTRTWCAAAKCGARARARAYRARRGRSSAGTGD